MSTPHTPTESEVAAMFAACYVHPDTTAQQVRAWIRMEVANA
jgi:hypothetical protein